MANVEKDEVSGQHTTGHEWDGIKELNSPLPSWWVWVFYATIIWAIAYWIVYPSIPFGTGYFDGLTDWNAREVHEKQMAKIAQHKEQTWLAQFREASVQKIAKDDELRQYAMKGGEVIFGDNCAPCHGTGGAGNPGFPTLVDDAWIWGGSLKQIKQTVTHGIRNSDAQSRASQMPAFGWMSEKKQNAIAEYVAGLAKGNAPDGAGKKAFETNCATCHGPDGGGMTQMGGPPLNDRIWLCPGRGTCVPEISAKQHVLRQIQNPKHGNMPAWGNRLSDAEIKQVTVWVHAQGGGQ